jgi:hypothetical protein
MRPEPSVLFGFTDQNEAIGAPFFIDQSNELSGTEITRPGVVIAEPIGEFVETAEARKRSNIAAQAIPSTSA